VVHLVDDAPVPAPPPNTGNAILVAALLALFGVFVSQLMQGWLGWGSNRRSQESLAQAREQAQDVSRRAHQDALNQRYHDAAAQLGHAEAPVRLAGVYAMSRLADDWVERRQQCVDVLCAYLRLPYEPKAGAKGHRPGDREVRRTIIRQIRDHMRPSSEARWDGCNFIFEGAVFDCGDLSKAEFRKGCHVSFYGARFVDGTFDLWKIRLLDGSRMYFEKAETRGGSIRLANAWIAKGGNLSLKGATLAEGSVVRDDVKVEAGAKVDWGPLGALE